MGVRINSGDRMTDRKRPRLTQLKSRVAELAPRLRHVQSAGRASGLYGAQWERLRAAHLAENPLCVRCEAESRVTIARVVDHKVPHRGNRELFFDPANLQSLCTPHHSSWKQRQESGGALG